MDEDDFAGIITGIVIVGFIALVGAGIGYNVASNSVQMELFCDDAGFDDYTDLNDDIKYCKNSETGEIKYFNKKDVRGGLDDIFFIETGCQAECISPDSIVIIHR